MRPPTCLVQKGLQSRDHPTQQIGDGELSVTGEAGEGRAGVRGETMMTMKVKMEVMVIHAGGGVEEGVASSEGTDLAMLEGEEQEHLAMRALSRLEMTIMITTGARRMARVEAVGVVEDEVVEDTVVVVVSVEVVEDSEEDSEVVSEVATAVDVVEAKTVEMEMETVAPGVVTEAGAKEGGVVEGSGEEKGDVVGVDIVAKTRGRATPRT